MVSSLNAWRREAVALPRVWSYTLSYEVCFGMAVRIEYGVSAAAAGSTDDLTMQHRYGTMSSADDGVDSFVQISDRLARLYQTPYHHEYHQMAQTEKIQRTYEIDKLARKMAKSMAKVKHAGDPRCTYVV